MRTDTLYKYGIFLSSWSIFFYGYFFRNSISPIVDVLEKELDTTATGVGVLGSFIHLFYFSPQIGYGILLQCVPGKYVLPASSVLLGVACLLFSLSENAEFATITSSMAGLVMAPSWLCFVRIIDDLFSRNEVPLVIGVQMTLTYSGLFVGNYVQAQVYQTHKEWRTVFVVLAVGCWASAVVLIAFVYCNDHRQPQPQSTRTRSLTQRELVDLENTENTENDETRLLPNTEISKISKLSEMKRALKRAFCLKLNWILSLWGFCGLSIVNGFIGLWFISYLMTKFGYSRSTASLISGSFYLMRALSAPLFGRLAMRFSKRRIFLIFGAFLWIGTVLIVYALQSEAPMAAVIAFNFVSGIGAGSWGIMWSLQREYNAYYSCKDMAAGLVNTAINASGFVTQLFIGEMLDIRWEQREGELDDEGVRKYNTNDYDYALLILPIVVVIAIISALFLKETNGNNLDYSTKTAK